MRDAMPEKPEDTHKKKLNIHYCRYSHSNQGVCYINQF